MQFVIIPNIPTIWFKLFVTTLFLAVLAMVPQRIPAPLPLQRSGVIVGVHGEAPGLSLLARGLVEAVHGDGLILDKAVITGEGLSLSEMPR